MIWWHYLLAGLFGGICGGMGMGGGTLLIPILTMFIGVDQHVAQGLNLLVFVPTGIIAVAIHAKNKLLDYKSFWVVLFPAIFMAILAALFVGQIKSEILRYCFGGFLILVGIFEIINAIKTTISNKIKKPLLKRKQVFVLTHSTTIKQTKFSSKI